MATLVRLRIILDTENDVFRDIEIPTDAPLIALHDAILKAFGWEAGELASFYRSNEAWDRGDEFPLLDLPASDLDLGLDDEELDFEDRPLLPKKPAEPRTMAEARVGGLLPDATARAVYVYDFLRMWCFYVEPLAFSEAEEAVGYPRVTWAFGDAPAADSREADNFDDLLAAIGAAETGGSALTGDPEIDAYLADLEGDEDGEDREGGPEFMDLDGLDDRY